MPPNAQFQSRSKLPGLHAMIIGVSDYPALASGEAGVNERPPHHFGLRKLTTAARAASNVHDWLIDHADALSVPLASCRLLISPSAIEQPDLADWAERATLENVSKAASAWRRELRNHPENVAFFFFAGHGLQRTRFSEVLVLEEFGQNPERRLGKCLELSNVIDGLAPLADDDPIARRQYFFIDACRTYPKDLTSFEEVNADTIWDIEGPSAGKRYDGTRYAPIYYTHPGNEAFGLRGKGSVFSETLLRCLDGGAAVLDQRRRRWTVTASSLGDAFERQMAIVNREFGTKQKALISGVAPPTDLHDLDGPPLVEIEISFQPAGNGPHAQFLVEDAGSKEVLAIAPVPAVHNDRIYAGNYRVSATVSLPEQPVLNLQNFLPVNAPRTEWEIRLDG